MKSALYSFRLFEPVVTSDKSFISDALRHNQSELNIIPKRNADQLNHRIDADANWIINAYDDSAKEGFKE